LRREAPWTRKASDGVTLNLASSLRRAVAKGCNAFAILLEYSAFCIRCSFGCILRSLELCGSQWRRSSHFLHTCSFNSLLLPLLPWSLCSFRSDKLLTVLWQVTDGRVSSYSDSHVCLGVLFVQDLPLDLSQLTFLTSSCVAQVRYRLVRRWYLSYIGVKL
jgi:hypothetical protein